MRKTRILAWAQARDMLGFGEPETEFEAGETPRQILSRATTRPERVAFCLVAVNETIQGWDQPVEDAYEIAILPPLSGG